MKTTLVGISLFSALPFAAAHGYLRQIAIDGKIFRGNIPLTTNFDSPIRVINNVEPVKGATNRAVNCGQNAKIATMVADANPGSQLTFDWAGGDNGKWPHNTGPMLTYLAECTGTTCDKFDAINAKWFKIDEAGKNKNGSWFQQDIMNGNTYTTTLPNNLAAGDYLVRHEIIALHLAENPGGAEFYPSCSQIRVGGNETGVPRSTVSLPGAYSDTDPGILDKNVFDANAKYTFPGPAIDPSLASGGIAITQPAPSTDGAPEPSSSKNTASPTATTSADESTSTDCVEVDDDDGDDESSTVAASATSAPTITPSASSTPAATASANNAAASSPASDSGSDYNYRPRRLSRVMARHLGRF